MPDMEDMAHVSYFMSVVIFILKYLKDGGHIPWGLNSEDYLKTVSETNKSSAWHITKYLQKKWT
jgi:hypothetical protein